MTSSASCLIIEVPAAEAAVQSLRERLDANARLGVPAHITVLAPFMPAETIDPAAIAELERLFARTSKFRFRLDRTAWFGDQVLWLAPRDDCPFRTLTQRVFQAFPAFSSFEGQFDDVIPHLTIGHGHCLDDLRAAEETVQADLPIDGYATAVTLITRYSAEARWERTAVFTLA